MKPHRSDANLQTVFAVLVFSVAIVVTVGLSPTVAFAEGKVTVNPTRVVAGESVTVAGTGWAPHDQILVSFSDPTGAIFPLGVITADANGNFQQAIVVPSYVPPGSYQIDGNGQGGSVSVNLAIVAPVPTVGPPTPTLEPPTATTVIVEPTQTDAATTTTIATRAPSATRTPTPTATSTVTATSTFTPTATATVTPTSTATATSTSTSTPTPTNTPTLPQRVEAAGQGIGLNGLLLLLPVGMLGGYILGRRGRSAS